MDPRNPRRPPGDAGAARWRLRLEFRDGLRFFDDLENPGRVGVADQSGPFPDETDDGVQWLDPRRPITEGTLPLVDAAGRATSATCWETERVAAAFGLTIDPDDNTVLGED